MSGKNAQDCWDCGKEVDLNNDKYYFFEPSEDVLCWDCCQKEGIDECGNKLNK